MIIIKHPIVSLFICKFGKDMPSVSPYLLLYALQPIAEIFAHENAHSDTDHHHPHKVSSVFFILFCKYQHTQLVTHCARV